MSLAAAKAAVVAQLGQAVASAVPVLPFDPPTISPPMVTVSTAGLSPTEYRLFIRVYVPAIQSQEGQDRLDALTEAIDAYDGYSFPRSDWDFTYDEVKNDFYMVSTVEYPREDFG